MDLTEHTHAVMERFCPEGVDFAVAAFRSDLHADALTRRVVRKFQRPGKISAAHPVIGVVDLDNGIRREEKCLFIVGISDSGVEELFAEKLNRRTGFPLVKSLLRVRRSDSPWISCAWVGGEETEIFKDVSPEYVVQAYFKWFCLRTHFGSSSTKVSAGFKTSHYG